MIPDYNIFFINQYGELSTQIPLIMMCPLKLSDQVPLSREEEARKFHSENLENKNEYLNYHNINLLSVVFSNIYYKIEVGEVKEKRLGYIGPWTPLNRKTIFYQRII